MPIFETIIATANASFRAAAPHIRRMRSSRLWLLPLLSLAACGPSETVAEAPAGAVERATDTLDRDALSERNDTIRRIENEAEIRADDSKRRIKAIERGRAEGN